MNSLPGNNSLSNQLSNKLVNDQRLLAKDTAKGQVTTATTVGRTVNQTQQDVKQTTLDSPKERVTLSAPEQKTQPEAKDYSNTSAETVKSQDAKATETAAQPASSKSAEALTTFTDTLFGLQDGNKKDFEDILTQSAMVDTSKLPAGESGREVALAATALRTAVAKLQAKMPNASKEQIREAAKTDPEIAKWASIADSSSNFLTEIKAESPQAAAQAAAAMDPNGPAAADGSDPMALNGAPGKNMEMMGPNPFRLNPEQQAQMFADNVKTMEAIQTIYQQMWAEISKARAQRHQLMMETANSINAMIMESAVNRAKTSQNHHKAMLGFITEAK
jgi:hypothetical protein